jgi:hypothetical protein
MGDKPQVKHPNLKDLLLAPKPRTEALTPPRTKPRGRRSEAARVIAKD